MSYGIGLKIENGFIHLINAYGNLPEGHFDISGNVGNGLDRTENLQISRRNADGTFAGSAGHTHPVAAAPATPEPEKPDDNEGF